MHPVLESLHKPTEDKMVFEPTVTQSPKIGSLITDQDQDQGSGSVNFSNRMPHSMDSIANQLMDTKDKITMSPIGGTAHGSPKGYNLGMHRSTEPFIKIEAGAVEATILKLLANSQEASSPVNKRLIGPSNVS